MHFTSIFVAALSAISVVSAASVPTNSNNRPDPSKVFIESLTYGGSGCPQGTVSRNFNADKTAFTLIFDEYVASIGAGVPLTDSRKNCQLNIGLRVPQGWQYSIATIDYRGYMDLDGGVKGTQSAIYYFQGEVAEARKETDFWGPRTESYTIRDSFGLQSLVWSPCGAAANVNIKSAISLTGRGSGLLTTDSIDGKVKQIYGIQWRRC
ncbi:hypothetical protein HDV05_004154 [Chytridiales sp. JEL 0842]|nr:hypothetical protein HDV05_004154 [Chytridiales sp. JEL 0842]